MRYVKPATIARPKYPENIEKWEKATGDYTKMAIFFDENFKDKDRNDELCYMYLYFIYYMLASKSNFFIKFEDYDHYALYAASTIYVRFLNKQKRGEEIESVLNYAKGSYYGLKVAYQNENFREVINSKVDSDINVEGISEYIKSTVVEDTSEEVYELFISKFNMLPTYIKQIIDSSNFAYDKALCKKLYISCLLSLLNKFTLSNKLKSKIKNKKSRADIDNVTIKTIQLEDNLIIWHLPEEYRNIVKFFINKIKTKLGHELNDIRNTFNLDETFIDSIIKANYMEELGL